jgi:hypothetical protein
MASQGMTPEPPIRCLIIRGPQITEEEATVMPPSLPEISDEALLLKAIAERHNPPLTLDQARERMEAGGDDYRKLLQRGHEAFREAINHHARTVMSQDSMLTSIEMTKMLDRHEVDALMVRLANDYWSDNYNRESDAAWTDTENGPNRRAAAHYARLAVFEYAWPGNQDFILRMHPVPAGQQDPYDSGF